MKLLFIDACPRHPGVSRTRKLCEAFLDAYRAANPGAQIESLRLTDLGLKPFDDEMVSRRDELRHVGRLDGEIFDLAHQFASADRVLIGAPYWDYSFPSVLKLYIEHISVGEVVFRYNEQGAPVGLCRAARAALITTAGGGIDAGDWSGGYLRALFRGLFGIPRLDEVRAEWIDTVGYDAEAILRQAESEARALAAEL